MRGEGNRTKISATENRHCWAAEQEATKKMKEGLESNGLRIWIRGRERERENERVEKEKKIGSL